MARTGWVAVAVAAVLSACGGSSTSRGQHATDDAGAGDGSGGGQDGDGTGGNGDLVCSACRVTGSGAVFVHGLRKTFAFDVIPEGGPGYGGEGVAAQGDITFEVHWEGAPVETISGQVDTIVAWTRDAALGRATFAGELGSGGRFEVIATDAGAQGAADAIAVTSTSTALLFGQPDGAPLTEGDIQVQGGSCGCALTPLPL